MLRRNWVQLVDISGFLNLGSPNGQFLYLYYGNRVSFCLNLMSNHMVFGVVNLTCQHKNMPGRGEGAG